MEDLWTTPAPSFSFYLEDSRWKLHKHHQLLTRWNYEEKKMKTRCSSSHILAPLSPSSWTAIKIYSKNIKNVTAADDDFVFVLEKNGFLAVSSIVIATSSFAFCALPEGKKNMIMIISCFKKYQISREDCEKGSST